jgi:hypothetical protein
MYTIYDENNIKMKLQEDMDSIFLAQGTDKWWWWALVNAVMNLRLTQIAGNFLTN